MKYISFNLRNTHIGNHIRPIVVQSMCNCDTNDIESAVAQCREISAAGGTLVRLTTQGLKEVESLGVIKERLLSEGVNIPLVADVHFNSEVAIAAAKVADKVRINPGNFAKSHEEAASQFKKLISVCKEYGTAIRIGINHGSLGERITNLYGNTSKGMQEAMVEWVDMCIENEFYNIVLSLKASNVPVMTQAYILLDEWMRSRGIMFPIHLGVTEAGNGDMGRIKSAVGIATLLEKEIGDTIRVSLTEPPVNEIPVGKMIADYFSSDNLSTMEIRNGIPHFAVKCNSREEFLVNASCAIGPKLLNRDIDDFTLEAISDNIIVTSSDIEQFTKDIFQATRRRITQCEYIACPSCGRTLYDIESVFNEVKKRTSHLQGITIAVMGCIVNGPGEMADADYGYIGEGRGKVSIYRGKTPVVRSVPQENAIDILLEIIASDRGTV